jgi:hypothetical protein
MSDTVLEHFLIRDYLRELSAACVTLPAAQARELREQITAHLDEALPPDATAEEVQAELVRLGRPRSLAAEAAGPGWQPVARRLRNWLGHVRWWIWVALVLVVSMIGTGAGVLISMNSAAPLMQDTAFGWYFPQDRGHDVLTQAGDTQQDTIAQRYRQEQGFVINIINDSDWTQTVLGAYQPFPGAGFYPFSNRPAQIAIGTDKNVDLGGMDEPSQIHWSATGSIPPHSIRALRVLWDSNICWIPRTPPAYIQDFELIVRVGTVTRTEDIRLFWAVALAGNKGAQCS